VNQRISKATSASRQTRSLARVFRQSPWLFPLLGLLVGGFCSALIVGSVFAYKNSPQLAALIPRISGLFSKATPGPDCGGPLLTLGATSLPIESIDLAPDGSVNVPADTPGVAYWFEGIGSNYIFALSPTLDNLTLVNALQSGKEAIVTRENCNSAKYILSAPEPGEPGMEIIQDQSTSKLIVYIPDSSLAPGLMVQGEQVEEIFRPFETAEPGSFVIDAEVSLLETSTSDDGTTIQVAISILNYGTTPFPVSDGNILLTPEEAAPLALIHSEPSLPQELKPKESMTFYLDFPRPPSTTATLRIFNIEFSLEDY